MANTTRVPASSDTDGATLVSGLTAGVLGGLAGGLVFGMLMQMMGRMEMVAKLVGGSGSLVGWGVHLVISAVIGAIFVPVVAGRLAGSGSALALGAGYGLIWWVLGALVLMPAKLGMPLFQVGLSSIQSIMGHMIYGVVLAMVARRLLVRGNRT
jgi:uncharacterized membrane protein YagU involved in acid resistance